MAKKVIRPSCFIGILFLLICVFTACSAAAPQLAVQAGNANAKPTLVVTPVAGEPSAAVTYYGCGFAPGEKITLTVKTPGFTWTTAPIEKMGVLEANEWGAFVFENKRPNKGVDFGIYTMVAAGDKGSVATSPWGYMEPKKK